MLLIPPKEASLKAAHFLTWSTATWVQAELGYCIGYYLLLYIYILYHTRYLHVFIYIYTVYTNIYICHDIRICFCMLHHYVIHICTFTYLHIHTHTHIYICAYIYIMYIVYLRNASQLKSLPSEAPIGTAVPRSFARCTACRWSSRRPRDAWAPRSRFAACLGRRNGGWPVISWFS